MFGATRRTDVETSAGRKCASPAFRPPGRLPRGRGLFPPRYRRNHACAHSHRPGRSPRARRCDRDVTERPDRQRSVRVLDRPRCDGGSVRPDRARRRPDCGRRAQSHRRATCDRHLRPPPPRKGPQRPAGAAASSSPSTGASEEQEWRQSPPQPGKLASILPGARQQRFQPAPLLLPPRGLRYAGVLLSDGLMALVRRSKSALETDAGGRISGDRSWLCSALRPIVTGRGAGRRLRCPEAVCLPASTPAWLPAGVTLLGRSVAGA